MLLLSEVTFLHHLFIRVLSRDNVFFGLLVGQSKQFEDFTLGFGKV